MVFGIQGIVAITKYKIFSSHERPSFYLELGVLVPKSLQELLLSTILYVKYSVGSCVCPCVSFQYFVITMDNLRCVRL